MRLALWVCKHHRSRDFLLSSRSNNKFVSHCLVNGLFTALEGHLGLILIVDAVDNLRAGLLDSNFVYSALGVLSSEQGVSFFLGICHDVLQTGKRRVRW